MQKHVLRNLYSSSSLNFWLLSKIKKTDSTTKIIYFSFFFYIYALTLLPLLLIFFSFGLNTVLIPYFHFFENRQKIKKLSPKIERNKSQENIVLWATTCDGLPKEIVNLLNQGKTRKYLYMHKYKWMMLDTLTTNKEERERN
jgi:hypothetical protein